MRTLLIGVLLSAGIHARAQYTHFNRTYFEQSADTIFISSYYIENTSSGLASISLTNVDLEMGYNKTEYNIDGDITSFNNNAQQTLGWGDGGLPNNSVLKIGQDSTICVHTAPTNCEGTIPYLFLLNSEAEFLWNHLFTEWMECDPWVQIDPIGLCAYSDTSFLLVCLYRPNSNNNLSQFRFTAFDFSGNILSNFTSSAIEWPYFHDTSISRLNDHFILSGNGSVCGTYDIQVVKTDLEGNVIQSNCYGNQAWQQGEPISSGVLDSDGNQIVMYSRCENYHWVSEIESKLHVLKVNTEDLSVIYDNHIAFDILDNGLISSGGIFTSVKEVPQGGYIGTFYYGEPTFQYVQAGIMKVTYEGELDWVKLYHPPNDFEFNVLYDIIPTPDGGFAAVGVSSDNTAQKHWLLKLDNCGYEQPSGCPAVVGVNEEQNILQLQLWPNPFYNLLKAVLPQNASRVFITDMTGRIVQEEKVYYPNQQFDVSQLATGVYLFNVECDDGRVMGQRVVKQ